MIVALQGTIERKEPMRVWLMVNGVTYEIFVSINTSASLQDSHAKFLITHIIREDMWALYGFLDEEEKRVFDTLIKINGVGPKAALAILSTYSPIAFAQIITNNDIKSLQRVPGIGPKSAGRILVELAGFSLHTRDSSSPQHAIMHESSLALEALGFKNDAIQKVLQGITMTTTQEVIKEALKRLQTIR